MKSIPDLAADLAAGRTTSRALVEEALARIDDKAGEGGRAFIKVWHARARAEADLWDQVRKLGSLALPLAGIPISVKDLFDIAGEPTTAGSVALADAAPAKVDAPIVQRLRAAGAVLVGRTNMTEFAYSGIGLNPHYGTPRNPWDRARGRIPGGSSSGAAVAATDGMCAGSIGSDTGGSVRIPAALCGITGFKPTARRVPIDDVVPLSTSLDSIGPLANSVEDCAIVDAVFAAEPISVPEAAPLAGLRFAIPRHYVFDDVDATVGKAFERACKALAAKGVKIEHIDLPQLTELPTINSKGTFAAAEAYAWHKDLIARRGNEYDPNVAPRIQAAANMTAHNYIALLNNRTSLQKRVSAVTGNYDAVIMPTCAIVAPTIAEVDAPDVFARKNLLLLRNTAVGNFLDRCAISLPCHAAGELPVGFMLMGEAMADRRVLAMARAVAPAVKG
jgi:aspartyl-tRNA(Asn)/glutamyl-tRNA(Gln) amidotransferase subunit A